MITLAVHSTRKSQRNVSLVLIILLVSRKHIFLETLNRPLQIDWKLLKKRFLGTNSYVIFITQLIYHLTRRHHACMVCGLTKLYINFLKTAQRNIISKSN